MSTKNLVSHKSDRFFWEILKANLSIDCMKTKFNNRLLFWVALHELVFSTCAVSWRKRKLKFVIIGRPPGHWTTKQPVSNHWQSLPSCPVLLHHLHATHVRHSIMSWHIPKMLFIPGRMCVCLCMCACMCTCVSACVCMSSCVCACACTRVCFCILCVLCVIRFI